MTDSRSLSCAASLDVQLLYPMSGLETEEPVLQPRRIGVLLGPGQTARMLHNQCLMVFKDSPESWSRIVVLVRRRFGGSALVRHFRLTNTGAYHSN